MSVTAPTETPAKATQRHEETHIAASPYTHALCGKPRGSKPLRYVGAELTCAVCLDLKAQRDKG